MVLLLIDSFDTIDSDKRIKNYHNELENSLEEILSEKKFYYGDEKKGIVDATVIESDLGYYFIIAELEKISYEELLQRSFRNAFERNPNYFEEDRITSFLYWHNDFLFDSGSFEWTIDDKDRKILYLSYFLYTKMTKYQDVITEKIFDRNTKILVTKTTRPIFTKIINHIKKNSV